MTEAYNGLARKVAEVVPNHHGHRMAIETIAATSDMKFCERDWTVVPLLTERATTMRWASLVALLVSAGMVERYLHHE